MNIQKIRVLRRGDDYQARLEGLRGIWGCGPSPDAAVGDLVRAHTEEFSIELLYDDAEAVPASTLDQARAALRRATQIMLDWPTPDAQEAVERATVALRKVAEARTPHIINSARGYLDRALATIEQVTRNWEIAKVHHAHPQDG